ncbi:MAG: hypothetical protein ACTHLW_17155 [Verrucomicrobiota bacterium]
MKLRIVALLAIPLLITGCASIVDGGPKVIKANTNPEGAKLTVFNKAGKEVASQTTPAQISLERASGFAGAESYRFVFEKEGYYPYETQVKSTINGWYFGNVLVGGIIGCMVDMGTGSCYTLSPATMSFNLVASDPPLTPEELKAAELRANPVAKVKLANNPRKY